MLDMLSYSSSVEPNSKDSCRYLGGAVYRIIIKEIHSHHKAEALAAGIKNPMLGTISFTQLAGSALNTHTYTSCYGMECFQASVKMVLKPSAFEIWKPLPTKK
jgi:hypothetical protein